MIPAHSLRLFVIAIAITLSLLAQAQRPDACPRDAKDFTAIQQKAAAKDPVAQTALAFCYDLGQHVQPDGKESIRLLTEAAGQGYAPAQYEVGRIYLYGRGVPIDYTKALLWERKAADQGDPRAQRDLAFMYERGFGVERDAAQVIALNRKAAERGDPQAQLRLAQALEQGDGVTKDENEARLWYIKAGMQKISAAQLRLGRIYARQTPQQCGKAIEWYGRAAASGEAEAMNELGKLYQSEKCPVERPAAQASYTWFVLAERFGSTQGRMNAELLGASLSLAQKRNADLAVARWLKKYAAEHNKDEDHEEEKR
jgi:TPR repeat protein